MRVIQKFFTTTGAAERYKENHADCDAWKKEKVMMTLIGGKEMDGLFKHTGIVEELDTYTAAITKVRTDISAQTNQAMARYKLMREIPQVGRIFYEWRLEVREQSDR